MTRRLPLISPHAFASLILGIVIIVLALVLVASVSAETFNPGCSVTQLAADIATVGATVSRTRSISQQAALIR